MRVILFTTDGCPRCRVLKEKLNAKGIKFEEDSNPSQNYIDEMTKNGIAMFPVLVVDNVMMNLSAANKWVQEQE
jgi:glutaredoxin